jgi:hypothetical protein
MREELKIAVLHHTSEYRGDHAADVCKVVDLRPGETVEALVQRVMTQRAYFDRIELKIVERLP